MAERSSEVRCEPTEVPCADLKGVDRLHIVSDGEMCADLDLADRRHKDVVDESLAVTIEDFQRPLDCFRVRHRRCDDSAFGSVCAGPAWLLEPMTGSEMFWRASGWFTGAQLALSPGTSAGVLTGEPSPRGDGQARGARSQSIRFPFRRVSEHEGHQSLIVAGVAGEFRPQLSKPRRSRLWLTVLVLVLVLAPVVAVCVSVIGRHWHAGGDQALEMLRVEDVGTSHTPLLGAWSRWGWAHPGPALFWALSPFYRVFGETGVPIGMGVLNGAAIVGVVLVAHRRGGTELAALAGLVMALLIRSLGVSLLVDIWNPWAAFLPFVLFVMLSWAVLCRDWAMLPIAVFVGSCVVQIHAGYLPLVAPLLAFVAAFAVVDFVRRQQGGVRRRSRSREVLAHRRGRGGYRRLDAGVGATSDH